MTERASIIGKQQTATFVALLALAVSMSVALGVVPVPQQSSLNEQQAKTAMEAVDPQLIRRALVEEMKNPQEDTIQAVMALSRVLAERSSNVPTDEDASSQPAIKNAFMGMVDKHGLLAVLSPEEIFGDQVALGNRAA